MCVVNFLFSGGIGATLGAIGTQLPYGYVHLVYWTIQVLLLALAVETGVILSADVFYKINGRSCGLCQIKFIVVW